MRFTDKLAASGILILDGGLATELEVRGCDLNQSLWSAAVLDQSPQVIREVHRSYLEAGADCIATASYQASVPGFRAAGFDTRTGEALYRRSIRLAYEARDAFCKAQRIAADSLEAPLVAASIGPYGAYLADGSEYRGGYAVRPDELADFHAERIQLAVDELRSHTDHPLLAFETIPSLPEGLILAEILGRHSGVEAWLSFSCPTASATSEGQPIAECVAAVEECRGIVALGVNCTRPELLAELVTQFAAGSRPVVAYPNAGGSYDAARKEWSTDGEAIPAASVFGDWVDAGARVLGGCCRSTPEWIAALVRFRAARP